MVRCAARSRRRSRLPARVGGVATALQRVVASPPREEDACSGQSRGSGVLLRGTAPGTFTARLKGEVRSAGGFVEPGTAPGRGCTGCSSHLGSPCPSLLLCISPTPPPAPELFTDALLRRRAAAVLQEGSSPERLSGLARGRRGGLSTPPHAGAHGCPPRPVAASAESRAVGRGPGQG